MKISLPDVLEKLISSPNIVSRRPIFEQYDKNVQGNTAHERGTTAAAITTCFRDFPELDKAHGDIGVALGIGGNPFLAKVSAKDSAIDAITQAYLQIASVGGVPLGATDCLNFGNPEKKDQMADLVEGIDGIKEVCEAYEIPIVSGNVSLYNECAGKSIPPSAGVAVFGRVDDVSKVLPIAFQKAGDTVFVLGKRSSNLGGSALLRVLEKTDTRIPEIDYSVIQDLIQKVQQMIEDQKSTSVSKIGFGGAIVAALTASFEGNMGLEMNLENESQVIDFLSEDAGLVISTDNPQSIKDLFGDMAWEIGTVTTDESLVITAGDQELVNTNITQWKKSWNDGLREIL